MNRSRIIDNAIELPVVTSFSRFGYETRRRLGAWEPLDGYDLHGRVIVVTGATSGLGRAAAEQLARCGATLVLVGRDPERTAETARTLTSLTGNDRVSHWAADMGEHDQVRNLADHILTMHERLDVVIHNAGALTATRRVTSYGTEATVASQVVGPFLLTSLLLDRLEASAPSRVITMSSGGMYAAALQVDGLEMDENSYRGTDQYARAKRAQVVLNEMWAQRCGARGIRFHSLHPGWASTPGVDAALPRFATVMGPILRTPEQGADTLVWLAADDGEPLETNGGFWLDRRLRPIHRLVGTRRSDTPDRRNRLWNLVATLAGCQDPGTDSA